MKLKFDTEKFQTEGFFERYYTHFEEKRVQKVQLLITVITLAFPSDSNISIVEKRID